MVDWKQQGMSKITNKLSIGSIRKKAAVSFAKEHKLIYFQSVNSQDESVSIVRGSTAAMDQVDTNYCIGSHAGYDIALVERMATVAYEGYKPSIHRWYVLQIDLHTTTNMPYMFIGTKQQSKAFYARLLNTHRQLGYLPVDSGADRTHQFHSHYVVLLSPAEVPAVHTLLNDHVVDTIAAHNYPFAIEIEGDSLTVITDALKPSKQLMDQLLHYGLWFAKEIDSKFV